MVFSINPVDSVILLKHQGGFGFRLSSSSDSSSRYMLLAVSPSGTELCCHRSLCAGKKAK